MLSIYRKFGLFFLSLVLISSATVQAADPIPDPISDLSVSLTAPASAPSETAVSYVFEVKNLGPNASETSDLSIKLPEKGEILSTQTPQGTCAAQANDATVIDCHLGKIEKDAKVQVVVQWKTPNEEVTLEISSDVTAAASIDEHADNDHATASTQVNQVITDPIADLKLFVKPIDSVEAGNVINYIMEVSNLGPDAAAASRLSMIIPRVGQYVSIVPEQGTCAIAQADVLQCDLQNIASGRTLKIAMRWKAPNEAGLLRFVASVEGQAIDTHSENNDYDFETTVEPNPAGPNPGSSPTAPAAPGNWDCSMGAGVPSASGSLSVLMMLVIPAVRSFKRKK